MKKAIEGEDIPPAVGPYSSAIKIGNMIFTSGQLPLNIKTGELVKGNITKVAEQIFKNIEMIMKADNLTLNDIIKVTVYSKSMDYFDEFNEYYKTLFNKPYPARSFIEVSKLPRNADLEVEVIAITP